MKIKNWLADLLRTMIVIAIMVAATFGTALLWEVLKEIKLLP